MEEQFNGSLQTIAKTLDTLLRSVKATKIRCPRCTAETFITEISMDSIGFDCPYCYFEIHLVKHEDT